MKNFTKLVLVTALIFSFAASASAATFINIGTGSTGGTYYPVGAAMAKVWNSSISGMKANAQSTGGTAQNLALLGKGEAEVIFADGLYFFAYEGKGAFEGKAMKNLCGLAPLYAEPIHFLVAKGSNIKSIKDLKGKRVSVGAVGSGTEVTVRTLLKANGIDPDKDVTIDWKSEHSECVAALASGQASIALLPQPFVTVAQTKIEGLRMALDLTAEWDKLDNGSALITGVIVARRDVVEANPGAVDSFLQNYAASVEWVNGNTAEAAALVGEYGIVDAAVAEKALPYCNIVCLTGGEMKDKLSGYLKVLSEAEPFSVGGTLPGDDFYYGG